MSLLRFSVVVAAGVLLAGLLRRLRPGCLRRLAIRAAVGTTARRGADLLARRETVGRVAREASTAMNGCNRDHPAKKNTMVKAHRMVHERTRRPRWSWQ